MVPTWATVRHPESNLRVRLSAVASEISIRIFDIQGREVDVLYDNIQDAGSHMLVWDASDFATGIYFANGTDEQRHAQPMEERYHMS